MRVAVVLGAGGVSGWAYHLGACAALEDAGHGLPRASRVVATSAGAAIAGAVLGGVDPRDDLAAVLRPPSAEDRAGFRRELRDARAARGWRDWLPAAPHLLRAAVTAPWRPGVAWAGLAPEGLFHTDSLTRIAGLDGHERWPTALRVTAVSLHDGRRVVLGRPPTDVAVADAVAASQAVPLAFTPREVAGERLVDGAVWSATHLDLVDPPDDPVPGGAPHLVVVVAPLSRPGPSPGRLLARRALATELSARPAAAPPVVVVTPDEHFDELADGYPRRVDDPLAVGRRIWEEGRRAVAAALERHPAA